MDVKKVRGEDYPNLNLNLKWFAGFFTVLGLAFLRWGK